mmetsp:Transcript_42966/g.99587  ORF Transcript_42966/g.99587 Transcript_42966/m.99587 type:complete len:512 (-) Transcript_42966:1086-2621(-)
MRVDATNVLSALRTAVLPAAVAEFMLANRSLGVGGGDAAAVQLALDGSFGTLGFLHVDGEGEAMLRRLQGLLTSAAEVDALGALVAEVRAGLRADGLELGAEESLCAWMAAVHASDPQPPESAVPAASGAARTPSEAAAAAAAPSRGCAANNALRLEDVIEQAMACAWLKIGPSALARTAELFADRLRRHGFAEAAADLKEMGSSQGGVRNNVLLYDRLLCKLQVELLKDNHFCCLHCCLQFDGGCCSVGVDRSIKFYPVLIVACIDSSKLPPSRGASLAATGQINRNARASNDDPLLFTPIPRVGRGHTSLNAFARAKLSSADLQASELRPEMATLELGTPRFAAAQRATAAEVRQLPAGALEAQYEAAFAAYQVKQSADQATYAEHATWWGARQAGRDACSRLMADQHRPSQPQTPGSAQLFALHAPSTDSLQGMYDGIKADYSLLTEPQHAALGAERDAQRGTYVEAAAAACLLDSPPLASAGSNGGGNERSRYASDSSSLPTPHQRA